MKIEDFEEYRNLFYWFQLHFSLRADPTRRQNGAEILREYSLRFVHDLATDPWSTHFRWEARKRGGQPIDHDRVRRPPRGMKAAEARSAKKIKDGAMPAKGYADVWLPYPKRNSVRCRFMLFDWLRHETGYKWNDFPGLYRSLLVFDLHRTGRSFEEIAREYFDNSHISDVIHLRAQTALERFFSDTFGPAAPPKVPGPYFLDRIKSASEAQAQELAELAVKRHYHRALQLIDLARDGRFKTLATLPPIKPKRQSLPKA